MAKPTIADVARVAGVSKGLVSFALNDRPGVAPDTKDRILGVAHDLGWRPSLRARSLSTDRAFALGLVIARDPDTVSSDPFFPAFIAGVESALAPAGQALVVSVVEEGEQEFASYRRLADGGRVDGVIVTDLRRDDPRIRLVAELGMSAVTLGHPDVASPFPAVSRDDGPGIQATVAHLVGLGHHRIAHVAGPRRMLHGARRAEVFPAVSRDDGPGIQATVAHLVGLGHHRIAHIAGPRRMLHGARRAEVFTAALRSHDLPHDLVIETDFTVAAGADATRRLLALAEPPTAVVYANDVMAIAGMGVAQRAGLRIPHDLSITGFDGFEVGEYLYPSLTTVTTAVPVWGRRAAELLLATIAGRSEGDVELPPSQLLVRESTAAPAGPPRAGDNRGALTQ
ncbi:MAG: LacI family DNA-binding transcriptional regulator [Lacisediminihabitans sp.]